MKKLVAILGSGLVFGLVAYYQPTVALAASSTGPNISGTAAVLDFAGTAVDIKFVANTTSIIAPGVGTTYIRIGGITTDVPTDNVTLRGAKLGGTNGTLTVTVGGKTLTTDEWSETIEWTGNVTLRAVIREED